MQLYRDAKQFLIDFTGAGEDLLHVHFGLAIFVVAALLLKRRMRSPWPLAAVAVFAVANEIVDFLTDSGWRLDWSLLDLVNTLFWPTTLFLLARRGGSGPNRVDRRSSF
ncbi:MAG: hypothetical protein ACK4K7_08985 [Allosphingosinicella sp.]|uniref:hypothetical protein n=1 Tax=Allosphingosinicella sp. TaxID=2823234 RepID=UPI00395EAFEA